jgi:steroid delta-isomerase-like uncharacterized protein
VQIIQKYYDAFNNQDWNTMLSCLTEDVRHDVNQGERQAGKEAFRSFLQKMDSAYSEKVVDLVIFEGSTGDRAAAEFIIEGVYKQSEPGLPPAHGQTYRLPVGAFFEIRRGLIDRVTNYYNLQDWIKQVS